MPVIEVPMSRVTDWDSFHDTFASALGFADFYGRNMDAWIDCVTHADEDEGTSALVVPEGDVLTLQLLDCADFRERCPEIYEALIECSAFVNWRRIEVGERAILALSFP
jgi:hypothetical protein